jgi:hypothetical protein
MHVSYYNSKDKCWERTVTNCDVPCEAAMVEICRIVKDDEKSLVPVAVDTNVGRTVVLLDHVEIYAGQVEQVRKDILIVHKGDLLIETLNGIREAYSR